MGLLNYTSNEWATDQVLSLRNQLLSSRVASVKFKLPPSICSLLIILSQVFSTLSQFNL